MAVLPLRRKPCSHAWSVSGNGIHCGSSGVKGAFGDGRWGSSGKAWKRPQMIVSIICFTVSMPTWLSWHEQLNRQLGSCCLCGWSLCLSACSHPLLRPSIPRFRTSLPLVCPAFSCILSSAFRIRIIMVPLQSQVLSAEQVVCMEM